MTFDQHDIAGALRERADKLQNEVEQASLLGLGDLIDSERHPGELGRWVEDAIRESANGVGPSHGGTHDNLSSDELGFPPAPRPLRGAAFHGLAGEFIRLVEPHSEADPAAMLVQFLVAFGNACGRGPGFLVESDEHGTNEFVGVVGETSKARKGSGWGHNRRIMRLADQEWESRCIGSGIASGEGLIHAVRDPLVVRRKARTKDERERQDEDGRIEEEVDPGVEEKRLLVVQGELAQVLRVMQREGNTVSPILRDLWDHGNAVACPSTSPRRPRAHW
jgi:hypothetical protein